MNYGQIRVHVDISRGTLEGSMTSLNLKITEILRLWKLAFHLRRPKSEPLVHTQTADHTVQSGTDFSASTMRTCRKCACISSEFIIQLRFHVVNLVASARAKMGSSCKQTLSSMSGLNIRMLELYRDYEVALILSCWTGTVALRII
jgi:hypothetical protein